MAANDYYKGAQDFPPHPQGQQGPPPPYNANYGQQQRPAQPSPQPGRENQRDYYPPQAQAPWQHTYNSYHHPSQHYYTPHSSQQYPPQVYPKQPSYAQQQPYQPRPNGAYPSKSDDYDRPSHHHKHSPKHKQREKNHASRDTFLGAGTGAVLGDVLIGPGVGTLGAAIIGGLGGNAHAKQNKSRSRSRDRRSRSRDSRR